jgi:hypothetical protein
MFDGPSFDKVVFDKTAKATSLKTCKVQYLNTKELEVNVALVRTSDYFIYDWSILSFVQGNPVKPYYPLFLHSPLLFAGDVQLWTLTFDTTNMADDLYFMTYLDPSGAIITPTYREYFYLTGGVVTYPAL